MLNLLKSDIVLQWRQKFWLIYIIIGFIYTAIALNISEEHRFFICTMFIMFDTSVLGLTFVGAIILLEKQQNILQSLFITPLSLRSYFLSKTISLMLISFFVGTMIVLIPNGFVSNFHLIAVAIVFSSIIFTLTGIGFSAKTKSLNQYIWSISIGTFWVVIPVVPYLTFDNQDYLIIFPMNAALDLMLSPLKPKTNFQYLLDFGILLLWIFLSFQFAKARFIKHIIR